MHRYVRASLGTLATLGVVRIDLIEKPTTAYVLQYSEKGCAGTCAFCPQSALSTSSKDILSRVSWPIVELDRLADMIRASSDFRRVCIQSVIKEGFQAELLEMLRLLASRSVDLPVSVALTPVGRDYLVELKALGVDRVGIGFDAATPDLFKAVRKPYSWETYVRFLCSSVEVFGKGNVYVHLICGLGESEADMLRSMKYFYSLGAEVALFAFTPVKGTPTEGWGRPDILTYRKMQLLRYLLSQGYDVDRYAEVVNDRVALSSRLVERVLGDLAEYAYAFLTSGCPNCNRPFYNESVRGPHYNYPSIAFLVKHRDRLLADLARLRHDGG